MATGASTATARAQWITTAHAQRIVYDRDLTDQERDEGTRQESMGWDQPGRIYSVLIGLKPRDYWYEDVVEFFEVVGWSASGKSMRMRALKVKRSNQQQPGSTSPTAPGPSATFHRPVGVGKFRKHSKDFSVFSHKQHGQPVVPRSATRAAKIIKNRINVVASPWCGKTRVRLHRK